MIKKVCLGTITLVWAMALVVPLQRLLHWTANVHGLRLPAYYLLIPVPTLVISVYVIYTKRFRNGWIWAWWLFPLICLPGIYFGVDPAWALRQWISVWMRGLALGASLAILGDFFAAKRILCWIYPVAVAACLFGLVEMITNTNVLTDPLSERTGTAATLGITRNPLYHSPPDFSVSTRPQGTQGNRIPYMACLAPFFLIALGKMHTERRWFVFHLLAVGAFTVLTIWSRTRSSWVALAIGIGTYLYLIRKSSSRIVLWTLGGLALSLIFSFTIPSARALMVTRAKSFTLQNRDIQHRLGSLTVVKALKGHWLFGVGYGNYPKVYASYYTGPFHFLEVPDNQYLRWLIENGIVGFGVLLAFLVGLGRTSLTHIATLSSMHAQIFYQSVFAAWISIAVTFIFFDGFYWFGPNMTFWCLLGILSTVL